MSNVAFDHGYGMVSAVSGTGSGNIGSIAMSGTSGVLLVWVVNNNSSAAASGSTAPSASGFTGGTVNNGGWTKIKTQADGTYTMDLWATTWSGGALAAGTITISSMPTNTSQWVMRVQGFQNATANETPTSAVQHAQNGSSPSVTTGAANDFVASSVFFFAGPVASPAAGAGYTLDAASTGAIGTYGVLALEYANAVTSSSGTVVTPGWTSEGGTPNPGIAMTVALVGASAPTAPAAPTAGTVATTSIQFNPGALTSGATSCNIQVTTAADTTFASVVTTLTGATASSMNSLTGLTAGTDYIARTQMVNANGTTNGPATATIRTLCNAPTGLVASAVANSANLSLAWTSTTGATGYNILRSTTNGSGYSQIGTSATNSFTDNTGLAANTNYYYVVQATNGSGASANSAQGTGVSLTPPAAPTSLVATPGNNQVSLTWTNATGAVSVNVKRSATIGGTYTTLGAGAAFVGQTFVDATATNGNTYYYEVSSINSAGNEGPNTSTSGAEYVGSPPPTGVTNTQVGTKVTVAWTAPSGGPFLGYNIYRLNSTSHNGVAQRKNAQPFAYVAWGTTSFDDNSMVSGMTYNYYVATVATLGGLTLESPLTGPGSTITTT
jgi:fibronectin type 3 domain-containing protein